MDEKLKELYRQELDLISALNAGLTEYGQLMILKRLKVVHEQQISIYKQFIKTQYEHN